jgi:hypothetical protein
MDPEFLAQSRRTETLIGSLLPPVIATIFVFFRFYSRAFIKKNWGFDDTWILISWVRVI